MPVDIRQTFNPWRAKHVRTAWRPLCLEGGMTGSQFGGSPLLAHGERWPTCKACGEPLQFFLELSLAGLPPGAPPRGEGTLQLFYCTSEAGGCETWDAFSGAHLVRLLTGPARVATHPRGLAPFPARTVDDWKEQLDYPDPEEHPELGLDYDYDFAKNRVTVTCDELGLALRDLDIDLDVAETIAVAEMGDKLGGWPAWIQGVRYPLCTTCGRRMDLVLQVDSEDNLPYMFGDAGAGHITQCRDHPEVLAFAWACS
jgi:uncharacterized protein YwqG